MSFGNMIQGTPWHVGFSDKLSEDENRRHKVSCIFYDSKKQFCKYHMHKCIGSSHCDEYVSEYDKNIKINEIEKSYEILNGEYQPFNNIEIRYNKKIYSSNLLQAIKIYIDNYINRKSINNSYLNFIKVLKIEEKIYGNFITPVFINQYITSEEDLTIFYLDRFISNIKFELNKQREKIKQNFIKEIIENEENKHFAIKIHGTKEIKKSKVLNGILSKYKIGAGLLDNILLSDQEISDIKNLFITYAKDDEEKKLINNLSEYQFNYLFNNSIQIQQSSKLVFNYLIFINKLKKLDFNKTNLKIQINKNNSKYRNIESFIEGEIKNKIENNKPVKKSQYEVFIINKDKCENYKYIYQLIKNYLKQCEVDGTNVEIKLTREETKQINKKFALYLFYNSDIKIRNTAIPSAFKNALYKIDDYCIGFDALKFVDEIKKHSDFADKAE